MPISVELDDADHIKVAFDTLQEGGKITMELQKTFWRELFGSLEDKFGVGWMIALAEQK